MALLCDISGSMRVGAEAVDAQQMARAPVRGVETRRSGGDFHVRHAARSGQRRSRRIAARWKRRSTTSQKPYGQTSLYDATAKMARVVAAESRNAAGLPQRAAVVVITDGIDTKSQLTPEQVAVDRERDRRAGLHRRGDGDDRRSARA